MLLNYPPVITMFIGGMFTVPKWVVYYWYYCTLFYPHYFFVRNQGAIGVLSIDISTFLNELLHLSRFKGQQNVVLIAGCITTIVGVGFQLLQPSWWLACIIYIISYCIHLLVKLHCFILLALHLLLLVLIWYRQVLLIGKHWVSTFKIIQKYRDFMGLPGFLQIFTSLNQCWDAYPTQFYILGCSSYLQVPMVEQQKHRLYLQPMPQILQLWVLSHF